MHGRRSTHRVKGSKNRVYACVDQVAEAREKLRAPFGQICYSWCEPLQVQSEAKVIDRRLKQRRLDPSEETWNRAVCRNKCLMSSNGDHRKGFVIRQQSWLRYYYI